MVYKFQRQYSGLILFLQLSCDEHLMFRYFLLSEIIETASMLSVFR